MTGPPRFGLASISVARRQREARLWTAEKLRTMASELEELACDLYAFPAAAINCDRAAELLLRAAAELLSRGRTQ